jgi:hypothetical protein
MSCPDARQDLLRLMVQWQRLAEKIVELENRGRVGSCLGSYPGANSGLAESAPHVLSDLGDERGEPSIRYEIASSVRDGPRDASESADTKRRALH